MFNLQVTQRFLRTYEYLRTLGKYTISSISDPVYFLGMSHISNVKKAQGYILRIHHVHGQEREKAVQCDI